MEKKTQKQPKDNGEKIKRERFDVFISYRGLDTIKIKKDSNNSNDSEKTYPIHSTSLARSIYQKFEIEGFKGFFDRQDIAGEIFDIIRENRSHYYIILVANYSFETLEEYHYDHVEKIENNRKGNEEAKKGQGYNFAKELFLINNCIKNNEIDKKKVFLFRIDNCLKNENEILSTLSTYGYTSFVSQNIEVINFPTNQDFSIKKLIEPDKDGKIKIETPSRESYKTCLETCEKQRQSIRMIKHITSAISSILVVVFCLLVFNCIKLKRYENNFIVFAGGGTVQQYLKKTADEDRDSIDIKKYPFSKYVHIPSTIAWHLLWDDVYEDEKRQYCPVVLSTGKIATAGANINKFREDRRIAAYKLDSVPLKVQIVNNDTIKDTAKENSPITLDSLKSLLFKAKENNYAKYEIWTTSKESGTYLEYKKLLNDTQMVNIDAIRNTVLQDVEEIIFEKANTKTTDSVKYRDFEERLKEHLKPMFDLDNIVNNQPGGRKDFSPENFSKSPDNKLQIILANEQYCYQGEDSIRLSISNHNVVSDGKTFTIPLYIYTIAKVKENSVKLELLPEAEKFLKRIGCNTKAQLTINCAEEDKVTVIWPPLGK